MTLRVRSPVTGRVLPLSEVTDPVFAQGMVGPGVALDPEDAMSAALSPVTGAVVLVHSHAFIVTTPEGAEVLVHLGIDTLALRGQSFTHHVLHGQTVRTGQPVISWDPAAVRASGRSALCPVIALDATATHLLQRYPQARSPGAIHCSTGDAEPTTQRGVFPCSCSRAAQEPTRPHCWATC